MWRLSIRCSLDQNLTIEFPTNAVQQVRIFFPYQAYFYAFHFKRALSVTWKKTLINAAIICPSYIPTPDVVFRLKGLG